MVTKERAWSILSCRGAALTACPCQCPCPLSMSVSIFVSMSVSVFVKERSGNSDLEYVLRNLLFVFQKKNYNTKKLGNFRVPFFHHLPAAVTNSCWYF